MDTVDQVLEKERPEMKCTYCNADVARSYFGGCCSRQCYDAQTAAYVERHPAEKCPDCGGIKRAESTRCMACASASRSKAERNSEAQALRHKGWTLAAVAEKFGLSREVVRKIVDREDRRTGDYTPAVEPATCLVCGEALFVSGKCPKKCKRKR